MSTYDSSMEANKVVGTLITSLIKASPYTHTHTHTGGLRGGAEGRREEAAY